MNRGYPNPYPAYRPPKPPVNTIRPPGMMQYQHSNTPAQPTAGGQRGVFGSGFGGVNGMRTTTGGGGASGQLGSPQPRRATKAPDLNDLYSYGYGGLDKRYDEYRDKSSSYLDKMGQTRRGQIDEAYNAQVSAGQQDLISRGLGDSTILTNVQQGAERNRQNNLTALEEMLAGQRLAVDQSWGLPQLAMAGQGVQGAIGANLSEMMQQRQQRISDRDRLGSIIESRNDTYPSLDSLYQLMAQYGQLGGGVGNTGKAQTTRKFPGPRR